MISNISTTKTNAKRFLLDFQLLNDSKTPSNKNESELALNIIRNLECIQLDPIAAVERNHHLVLQARQPNYRVEILEKLISNRHLFEYVANAACIIPIEDFPKFKIIQDFYINTIHTSTQSLNEIMEKVMDQMMKSEPLPSRALKSDKIVKGYWDNAKPTTKETTLALNILFDLGKITVAKRNGNEKFYTATENHVPKSFLNELSNISINDSKEALIRKYMKAYRIFDFEDPRFGWFKTTAKERIAIRDKLLHQGIVIPVDIKNVKRQYYILTEDVEKFETSDEYTDCSTVKFLPPLDNLLWRRSRIEDLFNFSYKWEIYFPESKREFGYYAMPILYGDKLIGRIDPKYLRKSNILQIKLLQIESHIKIDSKLLNELRKALKQFAVFHKAKNIVIETTSPKSLIKKISI
ncbi:crosslink repair DNA glycosylase YcaQ family protein [Siminovitchia sp. FSL H7-0308]|uniref:DNA glycosylase AlkZ-like family protein n=1 Tax=Siminovitchia sp. FSL H7-0308 TaxID=2921432 RepID=UPI0030EEE606